MKSGSKENLIMISPKLYISPSVVIESMRDNGYKNTAYAIAELIDNSIQAGANCVRLTCFEKYSNNGESNRKEIDQIAILDDGKGMPSEVLQLALEFGGSKHREDKHGMGKFGMGLPNSSVSQCLLTEVWSWTKGKPVLYTFLDIEKIKNKEIESIPFPVEKEIPKHILKAFNGSLPESGTIVLWSKLDRLKWKTSKSIKSHTEALIGRIYRRQLSAESLINKNAPLRIVFQSFEYNDQDKIYNQSLMESFKPNDPMYLYTDTTLPNLPNGLSGISAFEIFAERDFNIPISEGKKSLVTVRTSILKDEVCKALKAETWVKSFIGSTEWGKHMKKNIGLSVMRADRELELITDYYIADNGSKDRWIGVEIEFSPELDSFFGVTNNKQSATRIKYIPISDLALDVIEDHEDLKDSELEQKYIEYLEKEAPVESSVALINEAIKTMITEALNEVSKKGFEGLKTRDVDLKKTTEDNEIIPTNESNIIATQVSKSIDEENREDDLEPDLDGIKEHLLNEGLPAAEVEKTIQEIISNDLRVKFDFRPGDVEFFDITSFQGFTLIRINTDHSFYSKFMEKASDEEQKLLNLCLAAWGRMEKDAPQNWKKEYQRTRRHWGKLLETYLGDTVE